jgi:excisionase family DNA binding protein
MPLQSRFKKPATPAAPALPAVVPFSGPRLLTPKQAAEYIGHSVDLVREMIASREISYVPKGNGKERSHVLIDRLDLDKWIEKSKVAAA